MKLALSFFCVVFHTVAVFGNPNSEDAEQEKECRLVSLIPNGKVEVPGLDVSGDGPPTVTTPDPLPIENVTVAVDDPHLSGNYSLRNGLVTGLSTAKADFDYDPVHQTLFLNLTVEHARLTGLYEIIEGNANLTTLGEHTFSGSGPFNASIAGVNSTLGFNIVLTLSQQVLIKNLKLHFNFDSAYIIAENLVVDGQEVEWDPLNEMLKPAFDAFWGQYQEIVAQTIQEKLNWLLEGCNLMDIISIVAPPPEKP